MSTAYPPLLPLLRSRVQGDVLALTYLHPELEYSVSNVAAHAGSSFRAAQQEISRLVTAGFLSDRRLGNVRLVRAVTDSPVSRPLTDLLAVTYGPLPVLSDALGAIVGVDKAFIFGSWAARYVGEPGPVPGDVDVLVVGDADVDVLDDVARAVEPRLGRPVNIRRVRPAVWAGDTDDPFLAEVRSRPVVALPSVSNRRPAAA